MLSRPEIYRCQRCFHEFNLGYSDYRFTKTRWTSSISSIKNTVDETGEDYTEMMCIKCGEYMDKELLECSLCGCIYTKIVNPCYVPPERKYGKGSRRWKLKHVKKIKKKLPIPYRHHPPTSRRLTPRTDTTMLHTAL